MRPLIIISSQSLACGCLLADAVMRTHVESETPHLVVGEALPPLDRVKVVLNLMHQAPVSLDQLLLRQSQFERANPNQPWYVKFQKRRRRCL